MARNRNYQRSTNLGVWILVAVFVIIPIGGGIACCVGVPLVGAVLEAQHAGDDR